MKVIESSRMLMPSIRYPRRSTRGSWALPQMAYGSMAASPPATGVPWKEPGGGCRGCQRRYFSLAKVEQWIKIPSSLACRREGWLS